MNKLNKLNKTGLSTDPWGTPLVAGLQLDYLDISSAIQHTQYMHEPSGGKDACLAHSFVLWSLPGEGPTSPEY